MVLRKANVAGKAAPSSRPRYVERRPRRLRTGVAHAGVAAVAMTLTGALAMPMLSSEPVADAGEPRSDIVAIGTEAELTEAVVAEPTPTPVRSVEITVDGAEVTAFSTTTSSESVTEVIEHDSRREEDSSLLKGRTQVAVQGKDGERVTTYLVTKNADGEVIERIQVAESVVSEPVDEVIKVGTRVPPPPPPSPSPVQDSGSSGGTGGTTPAAARAMAQQQARDNYGWTGEQYQCLVSLWEGESNWNYRAANPTSTARGIPQAMMSIHFGSDWRTSASARHYLENADVQIRWGLGYIRSRYGNPCSAYNFWLSQSPRWY